MNINKATFTTDGNSLQFSMPIVKINKEARTVSGYATLDNVDTQGDIVTAEASEKAFAKWRGNIREMHAPIAVGKLLSFEPQTVIDPNSGDSYKGVFVNVYVSKGAEDTWQKVLDGTLTGFSIGGSIVKAESVFAKDAAGADIRIRKVTDYNMTELSLVDNPANQLANIISFQKSADGVTATGILPETNIENIFYCNDDAISVTSSEESVECHKCQKEMANIGWVEAEEENKGGVVKAQVEKYLAHDDQFAIKNNSGDNRERQGVIININSQTSPEDIVNEVLKALNSKGGVSVSKEELEKAEGSTEQSVEAAAVADGPVEAQQTDATNVTTVETETEQPDGQAAEVSEVEEPDLQKMFSDLTETLTGAINSAKDETEKALTGVREGFEKAVSGVEEKVSELADKFSTLEERVNSIDTNVEGVTKRVDSVESDTAIKKSGDLGGSSEEKDIKKSIWSGVFLPADNLAN